MNGLTCRSARPLPLKRSTAQRVGVQSLCQTQRKGEMSERLQGAHQEGEQHKVFQDALKIKLLAGRLAGLLLSIRSARAAG